MARLPAVSTTRRFDYGKICRYISGTGTAAHDARMGTNVAQNAPSALVVPCMHFVGSAAGNGIACQLCRVAASWGFGIVDLGG